MAKFAVGDTCWKTKSMVLVTVTSVDNKDPLYGQMYSVKKLSDGKEMVVTETGLMPESEFNPSL